MPAIASPNRRAMSLLELMLSLALVSAALGTLVLISGSLRADTAASQTRQTLELLRTALVQHWRDHGSVPPGPTERALATLLADPRTAVALRPLTVRRTAEGRLVVRDGYGREIQYLPPPDGQVRGDRALEADFVSAGPDGRFGDPLADDPDVRRAAIDNLYGADMERPQR